MIMERTAIVIICTKKLTFLPLCSTMHSTSRKKATNDLLHLHNYTLFS